MQFLRTLIWVLLAGIVVAFSINNWVTVPVRLWAGLIADINLPLLLLVAFAIGFVPLYLVHAAGQWRLKSRLANAERSLADLRAVAPTAPPVVTAADMADPHAASHVSPPDPVVEATAPTAAPMTLVSPPLPFEADRK
ncbi:LapA family protein [Sphingomonas qomolangmaensis]|uniref:Lipopolysaccharide assembly protein LapA domain-containing protein n=1 Tax=Sphingomonas qomolangmaensis TaxID=2918765 RepID=A0ABY5LAA6_9SPHN|nr:lipopolysaccharide assembly protein LapA domain-containing protein [Sphingomonas qomolangmaensis]UUL83697.1 lipopolysaccharide assembly protein LapA domain-containing protein [Sphingomonas qomolangmaensis]